MLVYDDNLSFISRSHDHLNLHSGQCVVLEELNSNFKLQVKELKKKKIIFSDSFLADFAEKLWENKISVKSFSKL